jgi:hypothetical protein
LFFLWLVHRFLAPHHQVYLAYQHYLNYQPWKDFKVTTFTTEDRINAVVNVEPIPFAGLVQLQDKEDTEQMLRDQLTIVQAECQRLKKKLMENGIHD